MTLELTLTLVRVLMGLLFHVFVRCRKAVLALPILALTSASVIICLPILLPRSVNATASSMTFPYSVMLLLMMWVVLFSFYGN